MSADSSPDARVAERYGAPAGALVVALAREVGIGVDHAAELLAAYSQDYRKHVAAHVSALRVGAARQRGAFVHAAERKQLVDRCTALQGSLYSLRTMMGLKLQELQTVHLYAPPPGRALDAMEVARLFEESDTCTELRAQIAEHEKLLANADAEVQQHGTTARPA